MAGTAEEAHVGAERQRHSTEHICFTARRGSFVPGTRGYGPLHVQLSSDISKRAPFFLPIVSAAERRPRCNLFLRNPHFTPGKLSRIIILFFNYFFTIILINYIFIVRLRGLHLGFLFRIQAKETQGNTSKAQGLRVRGGRLQSSFHYCL